MEKNCEVLVIGGGHAGVEAAMASARLGAKTILVSLKKSDLGKMSCNPAIGGLGKGQITKEIDALGGVMAQAIDKGGIQFRTLNISKGPAARASRAQADRALYHKEIVKFVENQENLEFLEDEVVDFELKDNKAHSVTLKNNGRILVKAIVFTTGTFLKGMLHRGEEIWEGGRVGDKPSNKLSEALIKNGIELFRLKTGTPARIKKDTIDFSKLTIQKGDEPICPFSMMTKEIKREQIPCYVTSTNKKVHEIIKAARDRAPLFNGQIKSRGPRYCPSIEDKVYRFGDKESHNIFLEIEGYDSDLVYPNGISTSLPRDVQLEMIHSIEGLENAEIEEYGYAVEYDAIDARILNPTLEHKDKKGLYFAGQINGTSGYEEAGGQGLLAGANAALSVLNKEPLILSRADSYIGVMVDDLITNGVDEPYRMFSSRAEYRLLLREDNTIFRLCPIAIQKGLLKKENKERFEELKNEKEKLKEFCENTTLVPKVDGAWLKEKNILLQRTTSVAKFLTHPDVTLNLILSHFEKQNEFSPNIIYTVETEYKFSGYLSRQEQDIARIKKMENTLIPEDFNYDDIPGLRIELKDKLKRLRPVSLGHATRIPGITPAALSLIAIKLNTKKL